MNANAPSQSASLDRALVMDLVRVTESAAIAASLQSGRGDENAADQAAVEAMRAAFDEMAIAGTIVIGEGERDEAPMLYVGEKVGSDASSATPVDLAVDPLEGTTITAKAGANALSVLAAAEQGGLLNAPDVYMEKIAIGPGYEEGVVSLEKSNADNVKALAEAKGVAPNELMICVLDRPRHGELIATLREIGCGIQLIPDGDIAGVIATSDPDTNVDMYMGSGGAPEGVLAAAALRCVGGQFEGRLMFRNKDERLRAQACGIEDLSRVYRLEDLAGSDCIFAATGVTEGSLLKGVCHQKGGVITTQSLVMRASTGTVRIIDATHRTR